MESEEESFCFDDFVAEKSVCKNGMIRVIVLFYKKEKTWGYLLEKAKQPAENNGCNSILWAEEGHVSVVKLTCSMTQLWFFLGWD